MSCCAFAHHCLTRSTGVAVHEHGEMRGGLRINRDQKAEEIKIFTSCQRPFMRGFHGAWTSFFLAFFGWFAFAPLMTTIRDHIELEKSDISNAGIASVATTVFTRFAVGPLIDQFGPRRVMASLLFYGAIPVALGGIVVTGPLSLLLIRAAIGIVGGAFVPCQAWTSMLFAPRIVGTANAFSAGWGNLGGGVTQIAMPSFMGVFVAMGADEAMAWRYAMVVPAVIFVGAGVFCWCYCDDCPQGKYEDLKNNGAVPNAKKQGASEIDGTVWAMPAVWFLHMQYGCCFGVELVVNNVMSMYLFDYFCEEGTESDPCGASDAYVNVTLSPWTCKEDANAECVGTRSVSKAMAGTIASLFGLANIFARGLGGMGSDGLFRHSGFRGRIWAQFVALLGVGIMTIIFSVVRDSVTIAVFVLVVFSIFVQAAEGTTYAMVPFIKPSKVGVAAGIVGAGGNVGAVCWSTMFKQIDHWPDVFMVMGICIVVVSFSNLIITIHGARITPFCSKDDNAITDSIGTPPSLVAHSGYTPEIKSAKPSPPSPNAAELEQVTLGASVAHEGVQDSEAKSRPKP